MRVRVKVSRVRSDRANDRMVFEFALRVPDVVTPERVVDALHAIDALQDIRIE